MHRSRSSQAFASPAKTNRLQNDADAKENMWSSLLDSVASGKRLPEKTVLVLGGTTDVQKEFLDSVASDASRKPHDRHRKLPPIANEFALGYTYQDVLDADHEDTLARLSIYTLPEPSPSFAPLIKPLLTARTVPDTLLLILLDWAEPWNWIRHIRNWILLLKKVLPTLDDDAKDAMEHIMQEWQQRRRGGAAYDNATGSISGNEPSVSMPLGPGEWDEALGLPLCVVCHNADKMDALERDSGWREEEFDYILQFLRSILLKYGASLVYTSHSVPNSLPTLVQSTLGIQSPLKRQPLKHNVVDRDRVLIPPNWDSWGKIRVLREGFDVEGTSREWSEELQCLTASDDKTYKAAAGVEDPQNSGFDVPTNLLSRYGDVIKDPKSDIVLEAQNKSRDALEIKTLSMQEFLAGQLEIMEHFKAQEEEQVSISKEQKSVTASSEATAQGEKGVPNERNRVNEHIGPVQFNIGGIQVDAEDMLKRLKDREREETPDPESSVPATPEGKLQNEALASFFAGLMKKGGSNSPRTHAS